MHIVVLRVSKNRGLASKEQNEELETYNVLEIDLPSSKMNLVDLTANESRIRYTLQVRRVQLEFRNIPLNRCMNAIRTMINRRTL